MGPPSPPNALQSFSDTISMLSSCFQQLLLLLKSFQTVGKGDRTFSGVLNHPPMLFKAHISAFQLISTVVAAFPTFSHCGKGVITFYEVLNHSPVVSGKL